MGIDVKQKLKGKVKVCDDYDSEKPEIVNVIVYGPEDTPYSGGRFDLKIQLSKDFPFKAPKIRFETKIYHCNVSQLKGHSFGRFRLNSEILKTFHGNWSAAIT